MTTQESAQNGTPLRRVFRYGEHEFDDPGQEYTVDQVRQALLPYFPELAHATADEQILEDGTLQITFRKQVTRKGNDIQQLALRLKALPRYADPMIELQGRLGLQGNEVPQICTLQTLLDHGAEIDLMAARIRDRAARTETMAQECEQLPSSAVALIPLGF